MKGFEIWKNTNNEQELASAVAPDFDRNIEIICRPHNSCYILKGLLPSLSFVLVIPIVMWFGRSNVLFVGIMVAFMILVVTIPIVQTLFTYRYVEYIIAPAAVVVKHTNAFSMQDSITIPYHNIEGVEFRQDYFERSNDVATVFIDNGQRSRGETDYIELIAISNYKVIAKLILDRAIEIRTAVPEAAIKY
jgi:membrane protein YdbS with pleckstrin-like domain